MKRLIVVVILAVVLAVIIAALWAFKTRSAQPKAGLPNPSGYDDFAAAAQWTVAWGGDLFALPSEGIRSVVKQNAKALETVHSGLKKQSAVPVTNDMNWFNTRMAQLSNHKSMAQWLVAEGLIHLDEGRTNEAARCFTDCIVFAHAAHRRGLILDDLVAAACQAVGVKRLTQVAPHMSPDGFRRKGRPGRAA